MQICVRNVITNNNEIEEVVLQRHLLYNWCEFKEAPSVKKKQTNDKGIYINFVLGPVRGIPQWLKKNVIRAEAHSQNIQTNKALVPKFRSFCQ